MFGAGMNSKLSEVAMFAGRKSVRPTAAASSSTISRNAAPLSSTISLNENNNNNNNGQLFPSAILLMGLAMFRYMIDDHTTTASDRTIPVKNEARRHQAFVPSTHNDDDTPPRGDESSEGDKGNNNSRNISTFSPLLPIRVIRPNPNLEIAFDVRTRNPIYVMERLSTTGRRRTASNEDGIGAEHQHERQRQWPFSILFRNKQHTEKQRQIHRRPRFYEEKSIEPETYRSRVGQYRNSGYDRGHMAPAADFYPNIEYVYDTFSLCNVSPQNHQMNISIWKSLEEWIRKVANEYYYETISSGKGDGDGDAAGVGETYVITGPLWLPTRAVDQKSLNRRLLANYDNGNDTDTDEENIIDHPAKKLLYEYSYFGLGIPPALVAVPTHFFKVIIQVRASSEKSHNNNNNNNSDNNDDETNVFDNMDGTIERFACFVIANKAPEKTLYNNQEETTTTKKKKGKKSYNLIDYVVPWTDLETVSGLQFFPQLVDEQWKEYADILTEELRTTSSTTDEADVTRTTRTTTTKKYDKNNNKSNPMKRRRNVIKSNDNNVNNKNNECNPMIVQHLCKLDSKKCQ